MTDRHTGDKVLNGVLKHIIELYAAPRYKCEEILGQFLQPKLRALQPRKNEKAIDYRMRVMRVFAGPRWALTRRKIALAFTDADKEAYESINGVLENAFVDGFNDAAYTMARTGIDTWPITLSILSILMADGIVNLSVRKLKKSKDIAYNEQRVQSAVHSAVIQGVPPDGLYERVGRSMANFRQNETISAARATVYGAADYGEYFFGLEAQKMGIEVEKTWLSIMDMRVRPSHKHLHGETIPLKEVFHGYHGVLRFPHDPEAHPAETMRCRCRMVIHAAGKAPAVYTRTVLPTETSAYRKWRDDRIREAGGELTLLMRHKRLMG